MNMIVLVLMMAVTVEALIEYAKTFGKAIIEKQWKTAATQAGASHAFVSGSGPSVVAFAADEAAAQRIIEVWRDTAVVDRIIRAKSPEHPNISVRQ